MKTINYSRLNAKNKARIDSVCNEFKGVEDFTANRATVSTVFSRSTKTTRNIITLLGNPEAELNLIFGKVRQTVIDLTQ